MEGQTFLDLGFVVRGSIQKEAILKLGRQILSNDLSNCWKQISKLLQF